MRKRKPEKSVLRELINSINPRLSLSLRLFVSRTYYTHTSTRAQTISVINFEIFWHREAHNFHLHSFVEQMTNNTNIQQEQVTICVPALSPLAYVVYVCWQNVYAFHYETRLRERENGHSHHQPSQMLLRWNACSVLETANTILSAPHQAVITSDPHCTCLPIKRDS